LDAPLDDLEPLRLLIGDARVVAIGESAHFVEEYNQVRRRLTRFLTDRCGFSIFAFEFGFSEAFSVDPWVQGGGTEAHLEEVSETAADWGAGDLLRFLRRHNQTSSHRLHFVGIDIAQAGGSLLPSLEPVANYLRDVDSEVLTSLERAIGIAEQFAGTSGAAAAMEWSKLSIAEQDALTATLARIVLRFRALEPLYVARSSQRVYDVALRHLEAASHADHMFRAMAGLFSGSGLPADTSVRDLYMAESVRWHLQHAERDTRIIVAAHNNHIQKTPVVFDDELTTLPMGQHLERVLGAQYVSLAVTSTADHIPEMTLDETATAGFSIGDSHLGPPQAGSIEAAALEAGLGVSLIDLRSEPRDDVNLVMIDRIRTQSSYMRTPVAEAFDGVIIVPTATIQQGIRL
jgi:erythromycin esterase